jgi:hypothetical protein
MLELMEQGETALIYEVLLIRFRFPSSLLKRTFALVCCAL